MEKTDKTEKTTTVKKTIATVKSPSKEGHIREGNGFSLTEIKAAGKTIAFLKELNIKIDYFRKSTHEWNIEQLKALKPLKKKEKKKKPYSPKEERVKARRKRVVKKKKIPKEKIEIAPEIKKEDKVQPIPKKTIIEPKVKTPPKTKLAPATKAKSKPAPKPEEIENPLTNLSGLGSATAKKFKDLGINSVEGLIEEDPEELAMLLSGVSADRIKKWVQEGKELLNK